MKTIAAVATVVLAGTASAALADPVSLSASDLQAVSGGIEFHGFHLPIPIPAPATDALEAVGQAVIASTAIAVAGEAADAALEQAAAFRSIAEMLPTSGMRPPSSTVIVQQTQSVIVDR